MVKKRLYSVHEGLARIGLAGLSSHRAPKEGGAVGGTGAVSARLGSLLVRTPADTRTWNSFRSTPGGDAIRAAVVRVVGRKRSAPRGEIVHLDLMLTAWAAGPGPARSSLCPRVECI